MIREYIYTPESWTMFRWVLADNREEMNETAKSWGILDTDPETCGYVQEFKRNEDGLISTVFFGNVGDLSKSRLRFFEIIYHESLHIALSLYRIRFGNADLSSGPGRAEDNPEETIAYLQGKIAASLIDTFRETHLLLD